MSTALIDAIHDCRAVADSASYQLLDIADALSRVGMDGLARELSHIAQKIVVGPREVSAAHGLELTSQLRHSEAMMGNLLVATIEGCIVPKPAVSP
jgi:hypothetical protein